MIDLKNISKDIARIDIDRAGFTTIFVRVWKKGFNASDAGAPDFEDMLDGGTESMSQLCAAVEAQGFSITMSGSNKARALRGEVTRVDFAKRADGWHIVKYCYGWTAKTRPMSDVLKSEEEINSAIAWCETHGWTIRKWDSGARAWKDKLRPVRDANGIRAMRRKAEDELQRGAVGTNKIFYDFAFDY